MLWALAPALLCVGAFKKTLCRRRVVRVGCVPRKPVGDRAGLVRLGPTHRPCRLRFRCPVRADGKHVVFGRVVKGLDVVSACEALGSSSGKTKKEVKIADCGQLA